MESSLLLRNARREKRSMRVRKHVRGNAERPRLCVYKSNYHLFAQIIDDEAGVTLVSAGTASKELKGTEFGKKSKAAAKKIGEILAKEAINKNISSVVFDRSFMKYHGVIAELANAAREAGLQF